MAAQALDRDDRVRRGDGRAVSAFYRPQAHAGPLGRRLGRKPGGVIADFVADGREQPCGALGLAVGPIGHAGDKRRDVGMLERLSRSS